MSREKMEVEKNENLSQAIVEKSYLIKSFLEKV